MYNPDNTKKLIIIDIAQVLIDYTSIQCDIDSSKIHAAELAAQTMDLKRLIGADNVKRCLDPSLLSPTPPNSDLELRELVIPALCYYTYSRCLLMFPGTFTDGGYIIDKEASDKNVTINASNTYASLGDAFMEDVFKFLKTESPNDTEIKPENLTPSIRTFGGNEFRATN
jgi:hypothetical protein